MSECKFCGAKLWWAAQQHVSACEQIMFGLLGKQVTPEVDEKPEGFTWGPW